MTTAEIVIEQKYILNEMREEVGSTTHKPSSFLHSVWFEPTSGRFLFEDSHIPYEIIEPLIYNNTLTYKGIENHQAEKMLRYILAGV
jgi:hypothetical protein